MIVAEQHLLEALFIRRSNGAARRDKYMTAVDLITYITWTSYLLILLVAVVNLIREPRRSNVNIALFFALSAQVIFESALERLGYLNPSFLSAAISGAMILTLPYILLRLVDDFAQVPRWFMRAMSVAWLLVCGGLFIVIPPRPGWLTALQVLFLAGLQLYAAYQFAYASYRARGVTKRRMRAVAVGSVFVGLTILVGLFSFLGDLAPVISQLCGLASAVSYFIGFATPRFLRRAWQEPELRAFLGRAAELPRLPDTITVIRALEQGAAASVGAPNASIGLWHTEEQVLRFSTDGQSFDYELTMDRPSGKVFLTQQPLLVMNLARTYQQYAAESNPYGALSVLFAPITAGEKRLGVLSVYAERAPIFANDDLELVRLLADQAAVILESRALIDEAARIRAREEATRLKDDFLSAAAHDLKTPLTTLVGRAQLLERRLIRSPETPVDLKSIQVIRTEAERLKHLVLELLDASRAERGHLVGRREKIDLTGLAREACERHISERHHCYVIANESVVGLYDPVRIGQLLDNLLENAVKYSPQGGDVTINVWEEAETARIAVGDQGIGIPVGDIPHVFDRFYRAKNVDDRQYAGMGLGLFICRSIVEQHGGLIKATVGNGGGTTIDVTLPMQQVGEVHHV